MYENSKYMEELEYYFWGGTKVGSLHYMSWILIANTHTPRLYDAGTKMDSLINVQTEP